MDTSLSLCYKIVYWAPLDVRDEFGYPTYAAAVELEETRFQNKRELFKNAKGEDQVSDVMVYLMEQDNPVILNEGRFYLGPIADLSAPELADPNTVDPVVTVGAVGQSPSLDSDADETLLKIWTNR